MSQIWKHPLTTDGMIEMPVGAEVLCVGTQQGQPYIWARVDQTEKTELRNFVPVPTGAEFDRAGLTYLGSCHDVEGWMVFHIFEKAMP